MPINNIKPSWLIRTLTTLRDSRWVWDLMGSLYNRRIFSAIDGLYLRVAHDMTLDAPARMLDVGAGQGFMSVALAAANPKARVTGIDFSIMQVRKARRLQKQRGIPNCVFVQANVMRIPFDREVFDAAASIGSIKHWPDGTGGLKEIHRVLKPGATFMISETDQGASNESLWRFIRRFRVGFMPDALLFWGLRHVIFGQSYSEITLSAALSEAGFCVMESIRVPDCPYVLFKARKL